MKELVNHLWRNSKAQIVQKSLLNCHTKGLHSIMLLESPGQTIRLYVAEPGNKLFQNSPWHYTDGMSLGFHPHHCNLTLVCVKGHFYNWTASIPSDPLHFPKELFVNVAQYEYKSQITGGAMGFELVDPNAVLMAGGFHKITEGNCIEMSARTLHTVSTDPFEMVAWLVFEGKEDAGYKSVCYSTSDLTAAQPSDLYQKPSPSQVRELLAKSGLLTQFN